MFSVGKVVVFNRLVAIFGKNIALFSPKNVDISCLTTPGGIFAASLTLESAICPKRVVKRK